MMSDLYQAYELAEILYDRAVEEEEQIREEEQEQSRLTDNSQGEGITTESDRAFRKRLAVSVGLEIAMVIAYCRPFLNSRGGQRVTVASRLGGRFLRVYESAERDLHNRLIARRNAEIAHSDGDSYSLSLHRSRIGRGIVIMRNPFPGVDLSTVVALRSMISKLLQAIKERIDSLEERVDPGQTIYW